MPDTPIYPKTLEDNIPYRAEQIAEGWNTPSSREAFKRMCAHDVLYFFNVFLWTYDPRRPLIKNIPFITYQFQDDTLLWDKQSAIDQVDNLIEKSRDLGCSWMFIGNDLHDWLFHPEKVEILWGSWKEEYVDQRGNMKTIFEKFRHALRNMPPWLLPEGFDWKQHDNYMRLINPATGSIISGESTNPNFGRGGRFYRVRFDEYAFWEHDEDAWKGAADSTNCRTALSTPHGAANKFAKLAKSDIRKLSLHWTQHPVKNKDVYRWVDGKVIPIDIAEDPMAAYKIWLEVRLEVPPAEMVGGLIRSPWYDNECLRRKDAKEVAEELDIDYARSGMPFFDLRMLNKQHIWTVLYRDTFSPIIPAGRHILVTLIEIDHKIEVREDRMGWLRIYEMPVREGQYVVSGDSSEGLAKGDEAFGVVREKWSRNVVADFNGAYDPDDFALKLQRVGMFYNKCMIAPENNNMGFSVCSDLRKMDCHLYWTKHKNVKTGEVSKTKPGFTTTAQSRAEMLAQAQEEIKKLSCEVRSPVILGQMAVFTHNEANGKPEALGDFLDDGVIAYAIGSRVLQEYPYRPVIASPLPAGASTIYTPSTPKFRFGKK